MSNFFKIVFLLLLNVFVILLCLIWFSYLGLVDAKPIINSITNSLNAVGGKPGKINFISDKDDLFLLENSRLKKKEQALDISFTNLKVEREKIEDEKQLLVERISEISNIRKEYEDKELSFSTKLKAFEDRKANYRKISTDLGSISPEEAVKVLAAHDDQDIIEIFRATDDIAKEKSAFSLVPSWIALMDPQRMASIQRKMTTKPEI